MKNWNWKQWAAFALVLIVLIAEIVSIFVAPWATLLATFTASLAFIAGWLIGKHVEIKVDVDKKVEK